MDREAQFSTELQALRVLCDETMPREDRETLMHTLSHHSFIEPEHEIVFASVRTLLPRGVFSLEQLRVHLNNRGFPDIDVEKYFQPAQPQDMPSRSADKTGS